MAVIVEGVIRNNSRWKRLSEFGYASVSWSIEVGISSNLRSLCLGEDGSDMSTYCPSSQEREIFGK